MAQMRLNLTPIKQNTYSSVQDKQLNKMDTAIPFNAEGDLIQMSNVVRYLEGYTD